MDFAREGAESILVRLILASFGMLISPEVLSWRSGLVKAVRILFRAVMPHSICVMR